MTLWKVLITTTSFSNSVMVTLKSYWRNNKNLMKIRLFNSSLKYAMGSFHWSERVSSTGYSTSIFRDLKPANVMLSKGHAKIGDFGFAKKKYKSLKI